MKLILKRMKFTDFRRRKTIYRFVLKRKIDLILGSEFTIKYQLEPFGYKVDDVIKLQKLPLPKLAGNYIAFNKSVAERVIKRFNKEYKKLK